MWYKNLVMLALVLVVGLVALGNLGVEATLDHSNKLRKKTPCGRSNCNPNCDKYAKAEDAYNFLKENCCSGEPCKLPKPEMDDFMAYRKYACNKYKICN